MSFFEPLPPPPEPPEPPERRWSPPAWDRPSEGTLPATLAVDAVLQQDEGIVVAVPHLDVFPNGFCINLLFLLDPHRAQDLRALHRDQRRCRELGSDSLMGVWAVRTRYQACSICPRMQRAFRPSPMSALPEPEVVVVGGHSASGCIHSHLMARWRSTSHFPHPPRKNSARCWMDLRFEPPLSGPGSSGRRHTCWTCGPFQQSTLLQSRVPDRRDRRWSGTAGLSLMWTIEHS